MKIVNPIGPKDAKIALVGEAPGSKEIQLGKPFVGASGQLLDKLMLRAGIIRNLCYITNVVKERPPNNNISKFIKISGGRVHETEEYKEYEKQLKEELEIVHPNVVVAVGAVSLWALCRKTGVTKWRGSVLESTLVPGLKVIPMIHPAAALRQYIFQYYIINDLKKVKRESEFPEIRRPKRDLFVIESAQQAIDFMVSCKNYPTVAFDIEVISDELSCFSIATSPNRCGVVPLFSKDGHMYGAEDELRIMLALEELMSDPSIAKVGHNMLFDTSFLYRKYGIVTRNIEDTMIGWAILYPDFPKGLDFLTSFLTDEPYYKDEGKMWKKLDGDDRTFWIYNAKDSAVTFECWQKVEKELKEQGNYKTYVRQRNLIHPLTLLMEHGINVDREGLEQKSDIVGTQIEKLKAKIISLVGHDINIASPKQLKDYFYGEKGYKPYLNRKTGGVSVDRMALKRLTAKGDEVAKLLLEHRALAKLKSTYLDVKLSADGRLRAAYNPVGTETGRLSSSKTFTGEGTNLQNQPKEMKPFLIADPNYIVYNVDLSQAENRIVAYISPEPKMIEAFETGQDVHSLTASLIFREPVDKIKEEHKKGIPVPLGDGTHTKRSWGKRANHSLNYGQSYVAFGLLYEMPQKEAKRIVEAYHMAYPGIQAYHRWVRQSLSETRSLTNLKGRKRIFLDRWGDDLFKKAYSFIPQSTVADIINEVFRLIYDNLDEVILLNQVHDSIVFEISLDVPLERHLEILKVVKEWLEQPLEAWGTTFRIPAEFEVGTNMQDMTTLKEFTLDELRRAVNV